MYRSSRLPSAPDTPPAPLPAPKTPLRRLPQRPRMEPAGPVERMGQMDRMGRMGFLGLALGMIIAAAGGCAMIDVKAEGRITTRKGWVLLPVQNLGETHMAGERVEELLSTLLRIQNNVELSSYTGARTGSKGAASSSAGKDAKGAKENREADGELELDERQHYERVVAWARERKFAYGIGGSVQEWRYRAGTEGEPAVGLTLRVVDLASGRIVFTAAGASPTPGRGSLSGATQDLLRTMLKKLPLDSEPVPSGRLQPQ